LPKVTVARWQTAQVIINLLLPNQSQLSSFATDTDCDCGVMRKGASSGCHAALVAVVPGFTYRSQTVYTYRASVHQAAKLVAALLRVARVTVVLAESNGSLPLAL